MISRSDHHSERSLSVSDIQNTKLLVSSNSRVLHAAQLSTAHIQYVALNLYWAH